MNATNKLGLATLGLAVAIALMCAAPSDAATRHRFDWSGTTDFTPWPNPPWNHWFQDANAFVFNSGEAGIIQNDVLQQGGNGLALVHEVDVDDDLNPGTPLNLSLATFSYDISRDSASEVNTTFGLGFYVYDLNGVVSPNVTNEDALGPLTTGPENNFMNPYLDANPDTPAHYDVIMNMSGATIEGLDSGKYRIFQNAIQIAEDFVRLPGDPFLDPPDNTVANPDFALGGYKDGFDSWGFRSFGGGKWTIDNFTVRDTYFVVPEPTALWLAVLSLSAIVLRRRNRAN